MQFLLTLLSFFFVKESGRMIHSFFTNHFDKALRVAKLLGFTQCLSVSVL